MTLKQIVENGLKNDGMDGLILIRNKTRLCTCELKTGIMDISLCDPSCVAAKYIQGILEASPMTLAQGYSKETIDINKPKDS